MTDKQIQIKINTLDMKPFSFYSENTDIRLSEIVNMKQKTAHYFLLYS